MSKTLKIFTSAKKRNNILHMLGMSYKHGKEFGKIVIIAKKKT